MRKKKASGRKKKADIERENLILEFRSNVEIGSRCLHREFGKGEVIEKFGKMIRLKLDEPFYNLGHHFDTMLGHVSEIYPDNLTKWETV